MVTLYRSVLQAAAATTTTVAASLSTSYCSFGYLGMFLKLYKSVVLTVLPASQNLKSYWPYDANETSASTRHPQLIAADLKRNFTDAFGIILRVATTHQNSRLFEW